MDNITQPHSSQTLHVIILASLGERYITFQSLSTLFFAFVFVCWFVCLFFWGGVCLFSKWSYKKHTSLPQWNAICISNLPSQPLDNFNYKTNPRYQIILHSAIYCNRQGFWSCLQYKVLLTKKSFSTFSTGKTNLPLFFLNNTKLKMYVNWHQCTNRR